MAPRRIILAEFLTLACLAITLTLCLGQVHGKSPESPVPLAITKVDPSSADPGDIVEILVSKSLRGIEPPLVYFGGLSVAVRSWTEQTVVVEVPPELPPGITPMVTVRLSREVSPPFYGFKVAPFRIVEIKPAIAGAGATVVVKTSLKSLLGKNVPRVEFKGEPVPIVDTAEDTVSVQVPKGLVGGSKPDVVLLLGQMRSEPFREFSIEETLVDKLAPYVVMGVIALAFLGGIVKSKYREARAKKRQKELETELNKVKEGIAKLEGADFSPINLPPLEVPDELVQACVRNDCVLFVGTGLSVYAGYPSRETFISDLLDWSVEQKLIAETLGKDLRRSLRDAGASVAYSIAAGLSNEEEKDKLRAFLSKKFLVPTPSLSKAHVLLKRIPFAGLLTTNFDNILERLYDDDQRSLTPNDSQALHTSLTNRERFILKLYGSLDRPDTVIVAPAQYAEILAGNRPFAEFMTNLFYSRTILFVGSTIQSILAHLAPLDLHQASGELHYALVPVSGEGWQANAAVLSKRYGVKVLPYNANADQQEVENFLEILANKFESAKAASKASHIETKSRTPTTRLKRILLKDIGPADLELHLDAHWNVLLGDNGLGKSTILKAIAVAMAGRDAESYADRLIRWPLNSGEIVLETDAGRTYKTKIEKDTLERTSVIPLARVRPLEEERWLVIGFPAIRALSWERRKDTRDDNQKKRCTPLDFIPVITGIDSRIDELKDWLIFLDQKIRDGSNTHKKLREKFFEDVLKKLLEPVKVEFIKVDYETKRITVKTHDAEIPIEAVSQGTASLMGWIGILIQRLYEIYEDKGAPDGSDPTDQYALVLVDEIDAHMHPFWQWTIVHKLTKIFQKIQFIVTTHSPLIVGGLEQTQVYRLRRSEGGKIIAERPELPPKGKGVAGLLTSDLFGLPSQLDLPTANLLDEKRQIESQDSLTDKERTRLKDLDERLGDIDFTARDPLFQEFVREMYQRLDAQPQRAPLTKEDQERRKEVAEQIVRELRAKKGLST